MATTILPPPPSPPPRKSRELQEDDDAAGPSSRNQNMKSKEKLPDIPMTHVPLCLRDLHQTYEIANERSGPVYAITMDGKKVAVKLADTSNVHVPREMINEARIYLFLKELQGVTIPQLVHFGYTDDDDLVLVTSFAGSPLRPKDMTDEVKEQAVNALTNLHSRGVIHGDLRLNNILVDYDEDGAKVKLIDFGYSRRILRKKDKAKAQTEMERLKRMLESGDNLVLDQGW